MSATMIVQRVSTKLHKFSGLIHPHVVTVRLNSVNVPEKTKPSSTDEKAKAVVLPTPEPTKSTVPADYHLPKEKFIPITRRTIIRLLANKLSLTDEEKKKLPAFCDALDAAVINRYHGVLSELKNLFDPINPDKDTVASRKVGRRERLDNEYWLLQKLSLVVKKANFYELPDYLVQQSLAIHETGHGVKVSVDPKRYDVLRFWGLGRESLHETHPLWKRLWFRLRGIPLPTPPEYYKRVIVAVRMKGDDGHLLLKAFKEVPVRSLESLVPDGKIEMSQWDKSLLGTVVFIGAASVLSKVVTYLADMHIDSVLIVTVITAAVAFQTYRSYATRRSAYLLDLSRMLYFKNIANNRGLLSLLVDRAEDESFKEALLVYAFLLTNRSLPAKLSGVTGSTTLPVEIASTPMNALEKQVEDWVHESVKKRIEFNAQEAVAFLESLGLLQRHASASDGTETLSVLHLNAALRNLPVSLQMLTAPRQEEADIIEGYDKDYYDEKEEKYRETEKTRKRFGWF